MTAVLFWNQVQTLLMGAFSEHHSLTWVFFFLCLLPLPGISFSPLHFNLRHLTSALSSNTSRSSLHHSFHDPWVSALLSSIYPRIFNSIWSSLTNRILNVPSHWITLQGYPFLQNTKCSLTTGFSHLPHWPSASLLKFCFILRNLMLNCNYRASMCLSLSVLFKLQPRTQGFYA